MTIPWGILLLFGGGLAIAAGFQSSGLSKELGEAMAGLAQLPPVIMIGGICLMVTFLTEVTSNTATSTLLMPVLAGTAISADINPALLMVPAAMSASCAFMLPIATPPNAIVFGSGLVRQRTMIRIGLVLNLLFAAILTLLSELLF